MASGVDRLTLRARWKCVNLQVQKTCGVQMRTIGYYTGSAFLALTLAAASAHGQTPELSCGAFELVAANKSTDIIDHPPEGDSPGDVRVGVRELNDLNGTPVGTLYFVSTLTKLGEGRNHYFNVDLNFDMAGGVIAGSSLFQRENVADQRTPGLTVIVRGGTGLFEGASGFIQIGSGETPSYSFDLDCD